MRPTHPTWLFVATQVLALMAWMTQALAGQVTLAWNAPTTNTDGTPLTDLAGYHVSYWQGSAEPQSLNVGNLTTYTVAGLVEGATYSFAVSAYNTAARESDNSQPLTVTVNAAPPVLRLRLTK